ncbi:hypothetical protein ACWGDS_33375 [Streptomyces sp. NPDC055059]
MNLHSIEARTRTWWRRARRGMAQDAGYSTETVIVTALLVIMGLAVIGIIASKVTAKAGGIDLG